MVIIKIDGKLVKACLVILIAVSLSLFIYNYTQDKKHESISAYILSNYQKDVEIFDISKGEVIKRIQNNSSIQREAVEYFQGITGMYVKINAIPVKGYIIRVPVEPSARVRSQWLNGYGIYSIDEAFVILPEQGRPYLLVLDSQYRPLFYNFNSSVKNLLKALDFHPEIIS